MRCVLARTVNSFNKDYLSGKKKRRDQQRSRALAHWSRILMSSDVCFWNVCGSTTGRTRNSASWCGRVRRPQQWSKSFTTQSCTRIRCLSARIFALMMHNEASYDTDRQNLDIERSSYADLILWITEIISVVSSPPSRRSAVRKSHGVTYLSGVLPVHFPFALQIHVVHLSGQGPIKSHRLWLKIVMSISELSIMMIKSSRVLQ